MYKLIRPLLFGISKDPETVHHLALSSLKLAGLSFAKPVMLSIFGFEDPALEQKIFGLKFKNPVGLAGGFDKKADALNGFANLGFGFLEVGTITKHKQNGNPRPRIFRLEPDEALINRMGFNNEGADSMALKLSNRPLYPRIVPVGINLGKSKITELSNAAEDYLYSFTKLYKHGEYFVVNVSSPNTPGLRQLQDKSFLLDILSGLNNYKKTQTVKKPIFVKTVVDLSLGAIDDLLDVCKSQNISGVIISNTLLSRDGLKSKSDEVGGLSGRPIRQKSTEYIRYIHQQFPDMPIVGVGGIFSAEDAYEKIKAGASLVQLYTGLIYEGPGLVKKINQGLVKLLQRDGFKNISEAVGVEAK